MSSPSAAPPPRPGRPARFTREQVLHAALQVIDSEPPARFTMRRVARELGVGVMTLYGYFPGKEQLLEGVIELALHEQSHELGPDARWEERLRSAVWSLYGVSRRHPHLVGLALVQNATLPGMFRTRERILHALHDGGVADQRSLFALGALCNYALGFAGAQAAGAAIESPDRIAELPVDAFPHLTAAADRYADHLSDAAFAYGLDRLIAGIADDRA